MGEDWAGELKGCRSLTKAFRPLLSESSKDPLINKENISGCFSRAYQLLGYDSLKTVPIFCATHGADQHRELFCPAKVVERFLEGVLEELGKMKEKNKKLQKKLTDLTTDKILTDQDEQWKDVGRISCSKFIKLLGHHRRLEAINEVIRNGSPLLKAMKKAIEGGKVRRLLAFDVEAFEHDQRVLLELGAAIYEIPAAAALYTLEAGLESGEVTPHLESGQVTPPVACCLPPTISVSHFVIKEHLKKKNGRFCANNRENFSFGKSQHKSLAEVFAWLRREMSQPGTGLIGHNLEADLKYLVSAKPTSSAKTKFSHEWFKGRPTFDTQAIFKEVHLRPQPDKLSAILTHYGIHHDFMHNAGNDAFFTLLAALRMAGLPYVHPPAQPATKEPKMLFRTEASEEDAGTQNQKSASSPTRKRSATEDGKQPHRKRIKGD